MSVAAAAPALLIGGSLVGAASSAQAARQQNKALQRSADASAKAAGIQIQQLGQRYAVERENRQAEVAKLLGGVRAAAAESGASQTSRMIESDLVMQAGREQSILEQSYGNDIAAISSGYQAQAIGLQNQGQSALLSAFRGAMGGISTAASLLTLGRTMSELSKPADPALNSGTYTGVSASRFFDHIK